MDANRKTVGAYFWARGGELGKLIHEKDWSQTPLGPIETWPQSLKTAVGIMLTSRQPIWIGWGESLIYLYNDPYKSIIGGKHPCMLGQPTAVVWREIWDVIGPMLRMAMSGDAGTYVESLLLIMERHGFREETYYTFSYSPIPDDDGSPGGIICANTDDTQRTIGERQMALLRDLAARTANARTWQEACERSAEAMGSNNRDIPFAMIYLAEFDRPEIALAGACGIAPGHPAAPPTVSLENPALWPFVQALESREMIVIDDVASIINTLLPTGGWEEPPTKVALLPISASGATGRGGVLVVGLNPFRLFDDGYQNFLKLIAGQISASIASAQAYEEERMRAEALAEVDRAKTAFFSNVSHEFRTPLTLILGPAEEILSGSLGETNEIQRAHLTTLHHNAVRLQKLVNTLLDYARVEAGRLEVNYEPVDIGLVTRDLASTFCSAVQRAGLLYVMNCPSIEEPVYVDRDMWEKIVLNLLSNALKFTFEGVIEVSIKSAGDQIVFAVRDTGVGITDKELPRLFDRFHRVHGSRARTQEGSGIGLALVQELVKLHGGSVQVESVVDAGTTFTISIPWGSAHLPKERLSALRSLSSTALGAAPFVEEALRWLPDNKEVETLSLPVGASTFTQPPQSVSPSAERILIADDNLEMRNYLKRLLEPHWNVTVVENGAKALESARVQRPDLVLSDVMMPEMDGFELLRRLRDDEQTSAIPVILLSARAGEESYIEGMNAGADDYIVKPFGARELVARVKALLEVTRVRRDGERRVANILESITDGFQVIDSDWRLTYMNSEAKRTLAEHGIDPEWAIGKHFWNELFPESVESELATHLRRAMTEGVPVVGEIYYLPWGRWYSNRVYPLPEGGLANYFQDITIRKVAEEALRENEERLNAELAATQRLQETSTRLIGEDNVEALYKQILSAAVAIMGADFASLQMLYPERGAGGELRLLGHRGFSTEAASFWEWVRPASESTCGLALRTGQRVIVSDVQKCDFMAGSRDLESYLETGIHAVQTTPLLSRDGQLVGMISTHWREPHQPSDRALRLLDVLARQAADLIERSKAAEALRESEQRFRSMADSSPNIIWLTDAAGSLKFVNRAYLEFLGISIEDVPSFDWRQIVHLEDRDRYDEAFMAALRERQPFHERVRMRRRDGEWRWLEARGAPIFDHGGNLTGYIGSSPDITDIYESQQALKELGQRKDEFLANMSHEIRSPLTGIMGYADILLEKLKDPDDIECLKTIKESGDYLIEIVNDILDLSKIEAGKLVLNIEDVSIHALLAEIQALMDMRAAQKKLSLSLRYESALPERIQTDRTRLRQILINLVSNAIKFTERGRVEMVVKISGDLLRIEVVDTGIGIAPEHQQILFQPFTQADTTSTREYGGTGLGLTITKRLVEMLGGEISFESELGKGSVFRVAVPIGTVEAVPRKKRDLPEARAAQPGEGSLDDRRVLVVDDREEICYLVSRYIREAGGRPETAPDGESAIEAIEAASASDPFHAMILDIHMPGMDGYEVARILRAKGLQLPIIALTAGAMVGDREKCLQAGCDDYLTKPIDRRNLVQCVALHADNGRTAVKANGGKIKVLLVDDSYNACKFLSAFLEKRGYEVRAAHDGASALAMAQDFRPDVFFLDIRLPDINGYELLQRLKELDSVNGARFIGLSGYLDSDDPRSAAFDHFLEKPLDTGCLEPILTSKP